MPLIEEEFLEKLQEHGLHVSHSFPSLCGGVWVCKPTTTPGHSVPGYSGGYISIGDVPVCPEIDAPMLKFYFHNDKWIVDGQDCAGEMGPADFIDEWQTPEEAVMDILDFFFGNPERMQKKASDHAEFLARLKP